jgi:hypothetical protein
MADLGKEVLFGEPEVAEPGMLGSNRVLDIPPIRGAFGIVRPGFRYLNLAEQAEFHRRGACARLVAGYDPRSGHSGRL